LQKLYEDLKDYGLGILAVNSNDDRVTVEKYVRENRYSFLIGLSNASGPGGQVPVSFKVDSYPTNYLLDANGTII
jgi:hypothetical protein